MKFFYNKPLVNYLETPYTIEAWIRCKTYLMSRKNLMRYEIEMSVASLSLYWMYEDILEYVIQNEN